MRRLKFTFITDDRFDKDIYNKLVSMDRRLKKLLKPLPVILTELQIRELNWERGSGNDDKPTKQFRKTYYLGKLNRSITWNDVYRTINKIKAPYYQFV